MESGIVPFPVGRRSGHRARQPLSRLRTSKTIFPPHLRPMTRSLRPEDSSTLHHSVTRSITGTVSSEINLRMNWSESWFASMATILQYKTVLCCRSFHVEITSTMQYSIIYFLRALIWEVPGGLEVGVASWVS